MNWSSVRLAGISTVLPKQELTSIDIERRLAPLYERLRLNEGRLELMTGIKARRVWPKGTRPSMVGTQAAQKLMSHLAVEAQNIDLLIYAGVCRDQLEPATASAIHANLKLDNNCPFFDFSNACLGMLHAMSLACDLVEAQKARQVLIVTGENSGPLIEATTELLLAEPSISKKQLKPYLANLTIGSAAVALLIGNDEDWPHGARPLYRAHLVDSSSHALCQGGGDINQLNMQTDSEELLKAGVQLARRTWDKFLTQAGQKWSRPDWVIGHQVGHAHERAILESLGLEACPRHSTYEFLGNTGPSALPATLADLRASQKIKSGDQVALLGIGSGLACEIMGLQW